MIEAAAIFAALPPAEETAIRSHIGELAAEVGRFVPVVVGYAHAIWVGWAQSLWSLLGLGVVLFLIGAAWPLKMWGDENNKNEEPGSNIEQEAE